VGRDEGRADGFSGGVRVLSAFALVGSDRTLTGASNRGAL